MSAGTRALGQKPVLVSAETHAWLLTEQRRLKTTLGRTVTFAELIEWMRDVYEEAK